MENEDQFKYDEDQQLILDEKKLNDFFNSLFPSLDEEKENQELKEKSKEMYSARERKKLKDFLSACEGIGFEGTIPKEDQLMEGTLGKLLFEYGLKNIFGLACAQGDNDDDFVNRFEKLLKDSGYDDILRDGDSTRAKLDLRRRVYNHVFKGDGGANITYILSKFYKLNNNNDIILDIQKKGTDLLKYMLEANSSKVINEGKYAYLSEIFSKIESRDLIRIINQKGKLDDKVKFVPSRYFNNLEGYSQQDSRVAEALLEHLIRLGDSKLIRLKGIKLLSSKEEHYEGSKKNPFRIEAEVSLKLTGDECRYITSKFKHNGMRMSIKEGTYRFKLNTVLDDLPEDSVAMLYNEFLRWGSIKRNENYFVQMQRTHFKEEISKTTESERAVVYYVIGGSVFVLGLAVRIVGVPAIGEIAMAGGAGITGATYKRRYQGPKIEKPNFSLTLSLE